jgi:hypothetical protein
MRKCPECAEENINESLFCKFCGRCLLAPDPEVVQRSTVTVAEHHQIPEGIGFQDLDLVKKSNIAILERGHQTAPSGIAPWVVLLNVLVFILLAEIARYIEIARYTLSR